MMGGMGAMMGIGMLFMVLSLVVVAVVVVLLVRWVGGPWSGTPPPGRTPMEILKARYAAGEIDRETFERMRRDLEERP
ncbi:MAG: SHOCT domain-containing protein [Nitrospirae bacterium]|nr:SHOCT domain-containing protein [Nitrospirota bacterium]